jgi:hypothetical protein
MIQSASPTAAKSGCPASRAARRWDGKTLALSLVEAQRAFLDEKAGDLASLVVLRPHHSDISGRSPTDQRVEHVGVAYAPRSDLDVRSIAATAHRVRNSRRLPPSHQQPAQISWIRLAYRSGALSPAQNFKVLPPESWRTVEQSRWCVSRRKDCLFLRAALTIAKSRSIS